MNGSPNGFDDRDHLRLVRLVRDHQQLFEQSPVAFVMLDARGAIDRMNERARSLLGSGRSGQRFEDLVDEESREHAETMLGRLTPGHPTTRFDARLRGTQRRRIEATVVARRLDRDDDEPEAMLLAVEDRTAFRQTQRALVRSERELRSILDVAPDAMCIVQDGRYGYVNEAWAAMLGRRRARLGDDLVADHITPEDRPVVAAMLEDPGRRAPPATVRLRSADGSERVTEMRTMATEYRDTPAVFVVARDLTERRRLEARMAQSERLATVGLLVAGVAHEINNPLTFIDANLEELESRLRELDGAGVDDLVAILHEAREGTSRVARIAGDLRMFQRPDDDERRPLDANRIVTDTLRVVGPKVRHRASLTRDLAPLPPVSCSEVRLVQVLTNLVTNGAEAMPTDRPVDRNRVEVSTWHSGEDVCIEVADNGVGIEDEALEQIFDPFFTTRRAAGGTGLGLAISNSIVQQMGGFIAVDSELGRGTRFVVHLPASEGPVEAEPPPPPVPAPKEHGDAIRVLLVDDEELTLRALTRALRKIARASTARSGRAAVDRLQSEESYDVILTDLIMEDGSGHELIEWIRTHRPDLEDRVVVMTGMAHPEHDAPERVPRIAKPFDLDELRALVRRVAEDASLQDDAGTSRPNCGTWSDKPCHRPGRP